MKKISKKKKIVAISLFAVVIVGGFIGIKLNKPSEEEVTYTEATAKKQNISTYYSYDGNIEAGKSQIVYSTGVYTVKNLDVKVGDTVEEGQILVEYDNDSQNNVSSAKSSLSLAQISLNSAKTDLERMEELYAIGGISKQEYEKAQDGLATAQIQLEQSQANYDTAIENQNDFIVKSKISGEVISVSADEGDELKSGDQVLEIVSYDSLEVPIVIDEYDMKKLQEGMEAIVTISSTGKRVNGAITELSKKATVSEGVSYFDGTISLESAEDINVGMSVEITVIISNVENVIAVPMEAIQYDEEYKTFVYLKDMTKQYVEVGENNGILVEIKSGLSDDDIVMVASKSESTTGNVMMPGMGGGMRTGGGQKTGAPNDGGARGPQ